MSNIFEEFIPDDNETIYKDSCVLDDNYIPNNIEEIQHRGNTISELSKFLSPALHKKVPSWIFEYGDVGRGKTAITQLVLKELEKPSKKQRIELLEIEVEKLKKKNDLLKIDKEYEMGKSPRKYVESEIIISDYFREKILSTKELGISFYQENNNGDILEKSKAYKQTLHEIKTENLREGFKYSKLSKGTCKKRNNQKLILKNLHLITIWCLKQQLLYYQKLV